MSTKPSGGKAVAYGAEAIPAKTPKISRRERIQRELTKKAQLATGTFLNVNVENVEYDFEEAPKKEQKVVPPAVRKTILCAKKPNSDECSGVFGPYTSLYLFSFAVGLIFGPIDLNAIYIISWFILIELAYFLIYGYAQPETPIVRGVTFLSYLLGFIVSRTFTIYADVLESRAITTINESQIYVPLDDIAFARSAVRNAGIVKENFVVLSDRVQKWLQQNS